MSLLRSERLVIGIVPGRMAIGLLRGRFKPALVKSDVVSLAEEATTPRMFADALASWFAKNRSSGFSVDMVLSNAFVRFASLPWSAQSLTASERSALLQAQFAALYGDMQAWTVVSSTPAFGQASLACAISAEWKQALEPLFVSRRLRLRSLQPAFVAGWNRWRTTLPHEKSIFAMFDGEILTWGLLDGRSGGEGWAHIRSTRMPANADGLMQLLARETVVHNLNAKTHKVLVTLQDNQVLPKLQDWRLTDATAAHRFSTPLAMALLHTAL